MQTNYIQDYIAYFSEIARKHKALRDFKMIDINEAIGAANSGNLQYPCLVLDTIKGKLKDDHTDNSLNYLECGFLILQNVRVEDFPAEMQALSDTFEIGNQIIAKINEDQLMTSFLTSFEASNVQWQTYGPVLDNCYGTYFIFKLVQSLDLNCDHSEVWEE